MNVIELIITTVQKEDEITREILNVIGESGDVTQRHLARRLGVALGLANTYLKRCVKKGLVKIRQAPANRYFYYLTPKGFAEKSRLTGQYLSYSFELYREASASYQDLFSRLAEDNTKNVIFCGLSELAEIASLRAHEFSINIVAIFQPDSTNSEFIKVPVIEEFKCVPTFDICVLTALNDAEAIYKNTLEHVGERQILVPSILKFVVA